MSNLLKLPCGGGFFSDESFSIEKKDGKEYLKAKNNSGVTSWNDLTDKPFYEETGMVEVLAETTVDTSVGYDVIYGAEELFVGKTYIVGWNGTKYECQATESDGGTVVLRGENTPFAVGYAPPDGPDRASFTIFALDGSTSAVISIYQDNTVIHPIEGKYLPKGTPWIEEVAGEEILPETTVEISSGSGSVYGTSIPLTVGEKYIVTFNGQKYACVAIALTGGGTDGAIGLGSRESFEALLWDGEHLVVRPDDSTLTEVTISINKCVTNIGKIDARCLPDGTPYVQENELLKETDATGITHPTFGQMWAIYGCVPYLKVGETYTVTYNGTAYKCVCQSAPEGLISDTNAVAMGNFSPVGGPNTGEPFAMLISYAYQEVDIIDLVSSTAVKVEISSETVHKMDSRCLPDDATSFTLVSPNGTKYAVTVSDDGTLTATLVQNIII